MTFQGKPSVVMSALGLFGFVLAVCMYVWADTCTSGKQIFFNTEDKSQLLCGNEINNQKWYNDMYVGACCTSVISAIIMFIAMIMKMAV